MVDLSKDLADGIMNQAYTREFQRDVVVQDYLTRVYEDMAYKPTWYLINFTKLPEDLCLAHLEVAAKLTSELVEKIPDLDTLMKNRTRDQRVVDILKNYGNVYRI